MCFLKTSTRVLCKNIYTFCIIYDDKYEMSVDFLKTEADLDNLKELWLAYLNQYYESYD